MKYRPEKTEGGWQQAAVADAQIEIKSIIARCVAQGVPYEKFMEEIRAEVDELVADIDEDKLTDMIRETLTKYAAEHYQRLQAIFGGLNARNVMMLGYLQRIQLSQHAEKKMEADEATFGDLRYREATAGNTYYADIYKKVREEIQRLVDEDAMLDNRASLRASVEMVIRGEIQDKMVRDMRSQGVKLAWIQPHANCSERCQPWQGKLYSLDGTRGTVDGIRYQPLEDAMNIYVRTSKNHLWKNGCISGFNCRHKLIPYSTGNRPQQIPADVIERRRKLETEQRKMEREIRHYKSVWRVNNKFSDKESKALAAKGREKYQLKTQEYERFCRENNLVIYRQRLVPLANQKPKA